MRPLSISVAAVMSSMPSGTFTSRSAGMMRSVAYAPIGPPLYATRSPLRSQVTPGPTASTTPAASWPMPLGNGNG